MRWSLDALSLGMSLDLSSAGTGLDILEGTMCSEMTSLELMAGSFGSCGGDSAGVGAGDGAKTGANIDALCCLVAGIVLVGGMAGSSSTLEV